MSFKCINFLKIVSKTSQVRYVTRWEHRRPKKVYNAEDYVETEEELPKVSPLKKTSRRFEAPENREPESGGSLIKTSFNFKARSSRLTKPLVASFQKTEPTKSTVKTDMLQVVFGEDGELVYTKMKDKDTRIGYDSLDILGKIYL